MRTTLTLDDDVYEAARAHSRATGKLGAVLSEMARRSLLPVPESARGRSRRRRFPAFAVPTDAPAIRATRIQRVLDEEGVV